METLMARRTERMDTLVSLSKRRGFVYPSSEIYGGLRASWDYGPLGVELKNNVKRQWWRAMVTERDDIVGIDSSVILAREVWEASGHVTEFVDPLTECMSCHKRFRADHLEEAFAEKHGHAPASLAEIACPNCGTRGAFTEPRMFNGMLRTYLGAVEREGEEGGQSGLAYLRPETAQGIFINFRNVLQTSRKKIPFGIGQQGKSFRNEITPGNFIFRTREFEQMEMEYFVKPGTDEEWHDRWISERLGWFVDLGLNKENLRLYEHPDDKRSHYSKRTVDIEYRYEFPGSEWAELEGISNRTDFDLTTHAKASGVDAGLHARRLLRGRGAGRQGGDGEADRDAVRPPDRAGQGGGAAAVAQRRPVAEGTRPRSGAAQAVEHRFRRRERDRPQVPPPGRDRHAVLRHRRLRHAGRPGSDRQGPRLHGPGAGEHLRRRVISGQAAAGLLAARS
jgi:glycyl-tRNA synthetase (class II)